MSAEVKHLPNAMRKPLHEGGDNSEEKLREAEKITQTRLLRMTIVLSMLSVIWLGVCGHYLSNFMGYDLLASLMPHELAGLMVIIAKLAVLQRL